MNRDMQTISEQCQVLMHGPDRGNDELNQHYTSKHSLRAGLNNHFPRFNDSSQAQFDVDDNDPFEDEWFVAMDIECREGEAPARHGNSSASANLAARDDRQRRHDAKLTMRPETSYSPATVPAFTKKKAQPRAQQAAVAASKAEADSALATREAASSSEFKEALEQAMRPGVRLVREEAAKQEERESAGSSTAAVAHMISRVSVEAAEAVTEHGSEVVRRAMTLTEEQDTRRAARKATRYKAMRAKDSAALRAASRDSEAAQITNDPRVDTARLAVARETATPNSDNSTNCSVATKCLGSVWDQLGAVAIDELTRLRKEIQDLKETHRSQVDRILTKITDLEGKLRTSSPVAQEGRVDGAKNPGATDVSQAGPAPKAQLQVNEFNPGSISDEQFHHILLHRYGQQAGQFQDLLDKHTELLEALISVANGAERNAYSAPPASPARPSTPEGGLSVEEWECVQSE